jgi:lipoprotein signal peptidase
LLATAFAFAAVDLVHKTFHDADVYHARTSVAALFMFVVVAGLVVLVPRIASNAAAVGAGIACGGALGNFVSLLVWHEGVPDPLVVATATQAIAFNLADVFALTGDAVLLSAAVIHGLRHRDQLGQRV